MLLEKRVKIHILNMGLIENTPVGKLIVTNLLAFAEFERAMIIERTQSGKAIAKTKEGFKEIGKVYFQISNIWKYESCTCSIDL